MKEKLHAQNIPRQIKIAGYFSSIFSYLGLAFLNCFLRTAYTITIKRGKRSPINNEKYTDIVESKV
ncbi:MAG: hypothetical protein ABS938_10040, partial [Psychrobacillus psychrodurans]